MNQLKIDLNQAQALMPAVTDPATRERLNALLRDAQAQTIGLHQVSVITAKAIQPAPVTTRQQTQLCRGLKTETFDEGKVSYIQQVSETHYFNSMQARQLLAEFDFDAGRAEAAAALYPHVVDQDDFPAILDVFTFDAGRDETCKRLNL